MRVPLNLASEPFRRDRQILVASTATAVLLLITFVILTSLAISERSHARETQAQLDRIDTQLARIRREQAKLDGEMRRPENEIVLDRSILINTLIKRKAISWTKIFSDLETVLPPNVRVVAIRPQANSKDQLFLDMTVACDSPEPVLAFIFKLEGSDVFGSHGGQRFRAADTKRSNLSIQALGELCPETLSSLCRKPPRSPSPRSWCVLALEFFCWRI